LRRAGILIKGFAVLFVLHKNKKVTVSQGASTKQTARCYSVDFIAAVKEKSQRLSVPFCSKAAGPMWVIMWVAKTLGLTCCRSLMDPPTPKNYAMQVPRLQLAVPAHRALG
ncbi:unnamed protein product, partial [Phaeothamnion confervicola]